MTNGDIVERLRSMKSPTFEYVEPDRDGLITAARWVPTVLAQEAADEIERLRTRVDDLEATLWDYIERSEG